MEMKSLTRAVVSNTLKISPICGSSSIFGSSSGFVSEFRIPDSLFSIRLSPYRYRRTMTSNYLLEALFKSEG